MSGTMGKIVIPYVGIDRVVETLGVIYKKGTTELSVNELASLLGCEVSNINNVTPTLGVLGLATVNKRVIRITDNGLEFIKAYNDNELGRAKEIIKRSVDQNEALKFVKSLLETRTQITGEEIGRALSGRFNKNWKNVLSYRNFGNSCASIIAFAGYGFYRDGVLSLKPITIRAEQGILAPEIAYRSIVRLLNALHPFERAKGSDLAKKLQEKESRIASELSVCVALRLVERNTPGVYRITEMGQKLVDPLLREEDKKRVFRTCLLNSPYRDIIMKLSEAAELSHERIGNFLAFHLQRDWTPQTRQIYGRKFETWLAAAGLIKKIGANNYRIEVEEVKKSVESEEKEKAREVNIAQAYEIGRILGTLEVINPDNTTIEEFENKLSALKMVLREYQELTVALDLLRKNFQLSIESKNPSIYKNNVDFIKQKVMEKLGVMEPQEGAW
ncbi:MAG: hypothetical protein QXX17_03230 [Conexivisphaerales archaeon]